MNRESLDSDFKLGYCGSRIITYGKLCCVTFICAVQLFDVVLGVLDDDLVWLPIKAEHNHDVVLLTVLHPPGCELQTFDLI